MYDLHMLRTMKYVSATLVLAVACNGCKKPDTAHGDVKMSSADQSAQDKLQPVIHCINQTFTAYEEATPKYLETVKALQSGGDVPSGMPVTFKIEPYESNHSMANACVAGLNKAAGMSPAMSDLDATSKDAAAALQQSLPLTDQFESYLGQKGYVADNFAKGKELDATLHPLLHRLWDDMHKIEDQVHVQETLLRQHELDAIDKQEGHSLRWNTMHSMVTARALDDRLGDLARTQQLTPQNVAAAIQPFQAALDEAHAYATAHPDASKPVNGTQPVWFSVSDELDKELGAARELQKALATPSTNPAMQSAPKNALHEVSVFFNGAVEVYNTVQSIGHPSAE